MCHIRTLVLLSLVKHVGGGTLALFLMLNLLTLYLLIQTTVTWLLISVTATLQSLELWNMAENKSMTVPAHENIIAALAQSQVTGMVASASHDSSIKLWK